MGHQDNRSDAFSNTPSNGDSRAAEAILRSMTQELTTLRQSVVAQLGQDVTRLQDEKTRLIDDINRLRTQQQQLQAQQSETLSRKQLAQQQLWAKQLAQVLAAHLQDLLTQQLNQAAEQVRLSVTNSANSPAHSPAATNGYSDNAYRLLASLDSTFSNTFRTLEQELNSYQSSLSQQLSQMHSLEQQGVTLLEALVSRLREQLEAERSFVGTEVTDRKAAYSPLMGNGHANRVPAVGLNEPTFPTVPHPTAGSQPLPSTPSAPVPPKPGESKTKADAQFRLGIVLVLLSTVALSIHNVVVGIIGNPSPLFGLVNLGGYIKLGVLGNSLLILWLRMIVVVPLLMAISSTLYPPVWRDIKRFFLSKDRKPIWVVVSSGLFLFLSQILIYIAIGQIGPGVAVTILFMYPIFTVPLAWFFFQDRPTSLRVGVMVAVALGVILTAWPRIAPSLFAGKPLDSIGIGTAVMSGIAFAFYLIFMQLGFKRLHPVPVSLVQFGTIFCACSLMLVLPFQWGIEVLPENRAGFFTAGLILGILTLVGYLTNNFAVRFMGAGPASIIASSGPAVTALLALLLVPVPRHFLGLEQIAGILIVTLAVAALAFERMKTPPKPAR
ncbi:MAG: DMT family transporter [Leptolyngbyaceae cyanobacterium bins.59]|nr:DMT family transporter [Leptolyngbyaceae cyanobacterium bins.59]